jgi:hypothetical protein
MSETDPGATSETDPGGLHEQLEGEANKLEEQSERLGDEVQDARQDWQQKRADPSVPGAIPPPDQDGDGEQEESPAPQAPPPEEGPSSAETAPEGATGPPKDQIEEDDDQ